MQRSLVALVVALSGTCGCERSTDSRSAQVVSTIVRADYASFRARPSLMAAKLRRMRDGAYDYYRGTYPVFVRDALEGDPRAQTSFARSAMVAGIGDAHPENVGVLIGADGTLGLEFNDFDAADRVPYAWDLRRLATGLVVATHVSNSDDAAARDALVAAAPSVARAAVRGYLQALRRYAQGAPRERVVAPTNAPNLDDLFRRGARDMARRRELDELTALTGATRALIRGAPDPSSPDTVFADLPSAAREALPALFERYRSRLTVPRDPAYFTVLDAVRHYGSGVASLPRVRLLVLVRGPTDAPDDDVILELKELGDSGAPATVPPYVWADSVAQRVRSNAYVAWGGAEREPLWSTEEWLGVPVQIRLESEGQKNLRAARMTGELGTPASVEATATVLGALLARVHASTDDGMLSARAILASVEARSEDEFVSEHANASVAYAEQSLSDWRGFRDELALRGPLLGFVGDPEDRPRSDVWSQLSAGSDGAR
ncbi:MAG: DUF2252 family protein [Polyangiales bacterium]